MNPVIITDTREKLPLLIEAYPTEVATLPCGDYGIKGFSDWSNPAFIVERKSLEDLVSSVTSERERFLRSCEKARQFRFRALIVECHRGEIEMGQYRSRTLPQSVLGSLSALMVRMGLHIVFAGDRDRAARELERMVRVFCSGIEKDFKRLNATVKLEPVEAE